jgi:hypothetical protein
LAAIPISNTVADGVIAVAGVVGVTGVVGVLESEQPAAASNARTAESLKM